MANASEELPAFGDGMLGDGMLTARACKRRKHSLPGSETEGVKRSGKEED